MWFGDSGLTRHLSPAHLFLVTLELQWLQNCLPVGDRVKHAETLFMSVRKRE